MKHLEESPMRIVVLETDLFPDRRAMDEALASLERTPTRHRLSRHDLRPALSEGEWDAVLDAILASDVVVTV
ncbi:MAG: hypothetical protein M0Z68_07505 [Gammaproteobacteria bacterium]|jgi:hypothetical protein|uniref:Uncharacterized protein n=2 Tax=Acidiferrobacter thiooxydans TaxID=163359 RepID=A0A368HKD0_9GAMM|nr:hypothetical protein [Gammaproteobacteria bacterium]MDA8191296.1 hypothetical protein [Gammaproteobacteria bacterium]RCN58919.1 hypothetical protein C4900_03945 [Acidiferrobacter thiooxydans]